MPYSLEAGIQEKHLEIALYGRISFSDRFYIRFNFIEHTFPTLLRK